MLANFFFPNFLLSTYFKFQKNRRGYLEFKLLDETIQELL